MASCAYCGDRATDRDHVWPRARGGTDAPNNIVWACKRCNSSKGSRSLLDDCCLQCTESRTPGDVDCETGLAYYACRCGATWQTFWNLQWVPVLASALA